MIKENEKYLNKVLMLIDALSIVAAFLLSWYIRFLSGFIEVDESYLSFKQYFIPVLYSIPIYLIIFKIFRLYETYRFKSIFSECSNILKSSVLGILTFVLGLYLIKQMHYSRYFLGIFTFNIFIVISLERIAIRKVLRYFRKIGYNLKHVLIVGYSKAALELINRFDNNKQWGYNVVGVLDNDSINKVSEDLFLNRENIKFVGKIGDIEQYLSENFVDEVFCTLDTKDTDKIGSVIMACEGAGIRLSIIPYYYEYVAAKPYVEQIDNIPLINLRYVPLDSMFNRTLKRILDLCISIVSIILLSPIILITAIIIKFTSPGPIIFKQERIGYNNKPFVMYKFRTMHVQKPEEEKVKWTSANDPRKTKFGSFLRRTSIDELPQLFNVLKGDMSIIGPRPERPHFVKEFSKDIPKYMVKHQVKPGITGWAQVNGLRGDTSIQKRIEFDIYYIENWNLLFDIRILWATVFKGLINENAY